MYWFFVNTKGPFRSKCYMRNMGRGYTEWYDIAPSTMKAIVRQSFAKLYRKDRLLKRKIKRRSN